MIKKLKIFIFIIFPLLSSFLNFQGASLKVWAVEKKIYYFYGQGCPHCAKVEEFFQKNKIYEKYPLEKKEVYSNPANAAQLNKLFDQKRVPLKDRGVPVVFLGKKYLMGEREIIKNFSGAADEFLKEKISQKEEGRGKEEERLTLSLVIGGALVDAINPCAFAVLIVLLSGMAIIKRDKTALFGGLAFSLAVFLSYFSLGLGVYKVLSFAQLPLIFLKIIGLFALILGFWNLKDFFAYKKFLPPLEIPFSWRPKMRSFLRKVTTPAGAFLVGLLVSLFLLPCTSGPYLVILGMLSQKEIWGQAFLYLILYNLIFISPMLLITFLVYWGLEPEKAEEIRKRNIRRLHFLAGVILSIMGGYILIKF